MSYHKISHENKSTKWQRNSIRYLSNYTVIDFIGQGAFSKVFLIENIHTKAQCAAKIYESEDNDSKSLNRFYSKSLLFHYYHIHQLPNILGIVQ